MDIVSGAQEDGTSLVNTSGLDIKDSLGTGCSHAASLCVLKKGSDGHCSSRCISLTYLFGQKGHGEGFVKNAQLSILALLVRGVAKDTSVQQRSVNIGDHRPDVSGGVGFGTFALGMLDAVQILENRFVVVHAVALVDRVDLASVGQGDVWMSQNELSDLVVECISVDTVSSGEDQVCGGAVHAITGCNHFFAGSEDILQSTLRAIFDQVDAKDGANVDTGVDVARAIQRVEHDAVLALRGVEVIADPLLSNKNSFFVLLGHKYRCFAGGPQGIDHNVVREHIQLLLVLALDIGVTSCANTDVRAWLEWTGFLVQGGAVTHRLIRLALRTMLSMNLLRDGIDEPVRSYYCETNCVRTYQVVCSELSKIVRSPLAALCLRRRKPSLST